MNNPFRNRIPVNEDDAARCVALDAAYALLWDVLQSTCENPSRNLSIAQTQLELSHAMAIKSVTGSTEVLP